LKKRTKKLLSVSRRAKTHLICQIGKNFLLLFFKKEDLPSFAPPHNWTTGPPRAMSRVHARKP
jgi:hypothetical protein